MATRSASEPTSCGATGILSAIDCKVALDKKGEHGVITIDAKFLHHFKEFYQGGIGTPDRLVCLAA